ncbi:hypothetical protein PG993_004435 [Apiospora rasikravindrae]|uniref:Peptidase S53 domain-containing protein n=1 Tax=Apiospora rasikravindrae TaxID=990691 RepID=A0ABR1TCR3_9PEZI
MQFSSTFFSVITLLMASTAMGAAVAPADQLDTREINVATDPVSACNCPNNCSKKNGSSCKFWASDGSHKISGKCVGDKKLKKASPNETLDLSIELHQPRMTALKTRLATISDPTHTEYGNHLAKADLEEYQLPDPEGAQMVLSWLKKGGIHDAVLEGSSVRFRSSPTTINLLLDANIGHYTFAGTIHSRTTSYSVPSHLAPHIRFVHPLSHFARPTGPRLLPPSQQDQRSRSTNAKQQNRVRRDKSCVPYKQPTQGRVDQQQSCPDGVDPICLRKLLGLPEIKNRTGHHTPEAKVRYAVAGFLEQYAHYDDIASFLQKFAPGIHSTGYNFTVQLLNNATNPQSPPEEAGQEASLDLEYAMALGYPADITYYLSGGRAPLIADNGTEAAGSPGTPVGANRNEPFLGFLQDMLALGDDAVPHVLSMSYSDDENTVPTAYAEKVCDLFAQLAARGTTVLVSSGDGGAGGTRSDDDCYSNDGRFREMFIPTFPGSCPHVTAVGATSSILPLQGSAASGGGSATTSPGPSGSVAPRPSISRSSTRFAPGTRVSTTRRAGRYQT